MKAFHVTQADLHAHLEARMQQRGVTLEGIRQTMAEGWEAADAKPGTQGKVMLFPYGQNGRGKSIRKKR